MSSLRYSVSYTKLGIGNLSLTKTSLWELKFTGPQVLRYVSKHWYTKKNCLTNCTKSKMLTQRLVFFPIDWYENGLLFTKRRQIMNKTIGYSYARTIMS